MNFRCIPIALLFLVGLALASEHPIEEDQKSDPKDGNETHYYYLLEQATENGRPQLLKYRHKFSLELIVLFGEPLAFSAVTRNRMNCNLVSSEPNRWRVPRLLGCSGTNISLAGEELEAQHFYFDALYYGTLTISDDFKTVSAIQPHHNRTLLFKERRKNE